MGTRAGPSRDVADLVEVAAPVRVARIDELHIGQPGDPAGLRFLPRPEIPHFHAFQPIRGAGNEKPQVRDLRECQD